MLPWSGGYTPGMKTAVSVPDDLFKRVDHFARRSGRSRSEVYSAALREYVGRHAPDEMTERLNSVIEDIGEDASSADFIDQLARRALEAAEW